MARLSACQALRLRTVALPPLHEAPEAALLLDGHLTGLPACQSACRLLHPSNRRPFLHFLQRADGAP
jgi:hypothetical protein